MNSFVSSVVYTLDLDTDIQIYRHSPKLFICMYTTLNRMFVPKTQNVFLLRSLNFVSTAVYAGEKKITYSIMIIPQS